MTEMRSSTLDTLGQHLHHTSRRDPLSEVIDCLSMRSWIHGWIELDAPWGGRVATGSGWFYLVSGHGCFVESEGNEKRISLGAGDLVMLPKRCEHRLKSGVDCPAIPIQKLIKQPRFDNPVITAQDGDEVRTSLFCGSFTFDDLGRTSLSAALPPLIHIKGEWGQPLPFVDHILRLIAQESASEEPCASTIINRLVRILFIKAVQTHIAQLPDGSPNWLRALADPEIGQAIAIMHAHPEVPWTVASLAEQVVMSRSVFSSRFTGLVGKPPLEYLSEWRMQKACFLLRASRTELKEIAIQVGYDSAAAFSKAFTRWVGSPPGSYRRLHTLVPEAHEHSGLPGIERRTSFG